MTDVDDVGHDDVDVSCHVMLFAIYACAITVSLLLH